MANPIVTGTFSRLLEEGLNALWGHEYGRYAPEWKPVFNVYKSTRNYEQDHGLYGLGPAPEKDEADAPIVDSGGDGFDIKYAHKTYGIMVNISEEAIEDNLYLNMAKYHTKEIMKALMETDEILGANILNRAFTAAYSGADGKELCATDHVYANGGTYANETTAAALSETSLEDMLIAVDGFVDERDIPIMAKAKLLVIPKALRHEACRILKSDYQYNTANNAVSSIVNQGLLSDGYHVMRRLTSSTAYFVTTDIEHGLKMFDRVSPDFKSDVQFETGNIQLRGRSRRSFGWTNPFGIEGNVGA